MTPTSRPVPTHGCARCGAPVALDVGLCERCNPLGLKDSASSQVHGTAIAAVAIAVVTLAVVGRFALAGVGPFSGAVTAVVPAGAGLAVTLEVKNEGSSAGQTTCRLSITGDRSGAPSAFVLSPRIEPGQQVSFTKQVTELGSEVHPLTAECRGP
ncbi:MAG: hypothetical protein ACJ761_09625 [Chloroflexota bacterium]